LSAGRERDRRHVNHDGKGSTGSSSLFRRVTRLTSACAEECVVRRHGTEKRNPYFRGKGCAGIFASNEPYVIVAAGHDKQICDSPVDSLRSWPACRVEAEKAGRTHPLALDTVGMLL